MPIDDDFLLKGEPEMENIETLSNGNDFLIEEPEMESENTESLPKEDDFPKDEESQMENENAESSLTENEIIISDEIIINGDSNEIMKDIDSGIITKDSDGNIITKDSYGNVIIKDSEGNIINAFYIDTPKNEDDTSFACEVCDTPLDASKYGKIICTNCGMILFRRNTSIFLCEFKTLDPDEGKNYRKIISRINNHLKHRNYEIAYKYCLEAEDLAPSESTTWEYFALTTLYKERYIDKKTSQEIIKNVKIKLEICNSYGIESTRYEEIVGYIANELFFREKARLNSFQPVHIKRKLDNYQFWKNNTLIDCFNCLRCFESCFKLYPDIRYLEEAVKELSKPYKWLVKDTIDGRIKNMPSCGKIQASEKRNALIREIKKSKPDYEPPEIEIERFIILEEEDFDPNQINIISYS